MSWKLELKVGGRWYDTALRFATQEEAAAAAKDTFPNWLTAEDRAVESNDPVNYRRINGHSVPIKEEPAT